MVSFVRIIVLMWSDVLTSYAIWVMMTYLTEVWDLSITHAAGILNVWNGVAAILPLPMTFIADSSIGHFSMLLLSSIAYCVGLILLSVSTPPFTGGHCTAYKPECIGDTQENLFYISLALMAIGISGHLVSLGQFLQDQVEDGRGENMQMSKPQIAGTVFVVLFIIGGTIGLTYVKPWSVRFGVPAICTIVATLLFLSGVCSYRYTKPQGSPLTTIFRVFVASASKMFYPSPASPDQLYENSEIDHQLLHTRGLSCLEKAAVIKTNPPLEQQEMNRWSLCRVTEVEETKVTIRMIPMWLTVVLVGLVSSIGNTYFLEQARNLNPKVGRLKVPLQTLLVFYVLAMSQSVINYFQFASCFCGFVNSRKYAAPVGIAAAMICSVLCCITAAKVEDRRLNVMNIHGLADKPDDRIPMSIFWLVPQFMLLGVADGLSDKSIDMFFSNQSSASMKSSLIYITGAVKGLGIIGSALTVHLAGQFSEKGGKLNWFQHTLNRSRLDKYYWLLAAMSAVNLGVYIVGAIFYRFRESDGVNDDYPVQYDDSGHPYDDYVECCCFFAGSQSRVEITRSVSLFDL